MKNEEGSTMKYLMTFIFGLMLVGCLKEDPDRLVQTAVQALKAQNYEEAERLLREAAKQDYLPAYDQLYQLQAFRITTTIPEEAAMWMMKSAEAGNDTTMYELSQKYKAEQSNELYIDWLSKSSNAGNIMAQNELGRLYIGEGEYLESDIQKAMVLFVGSLKYPEHLTPDQIFRSYLLVLAVGKPEMDSLGYSLLNHILLDREQRFRIEDDKLYVSKGRKEYEIIEFKQLKEFGQQGEIRAGFFYAMAYVKASNEESHEDLFHDPKRVLGLRRASVKYMDELRKSPPEGKEEGYIYMNNVLINYMEDNCRNLTQECEVINKYATVILTGTSS
ncbi:tetratricopeptide repeat protein [Thalassolituus oleivorans]|uniref:tetratricopeptide repeat protein n=1 Tax=Thalassolituus oleivorans TaxID=187493 RepID=UPI00042DC5FB|nr:sel1 repeat family protein [Thalassolituus oleivorans]AHK17755.1 hypothetical protein R615_13115 [Thalassolituus oleivorans R6-15]